jgi:hypothetical protein
MTGSTFLMNVACFELIYVSKPKTSKLVLNL